MRTGEWNDSRSMISRVSAIFGAFEVGDRSLRLADISSRTGLPKASVSRILQEMCQHGFLYRAGDVYKVGIRLFELGELSPRSGDLRRLALATMADLRFATKQTIHLAVLEGREVVYIEILKSKTAPNLPSRVGGRLPAHATGVGKALLAALPDDELASYLQQPLEDVGPRTLVDPVLLRNELRRIRELGTSYEREESGPGVACAAAAIVGGDQFPIAAISVSIANAEGEIERFGPAVTTAAMSLSRAAASRNLTLH